ncbi:MAG: glycoside hydrolase family 97 N-terminal domain-containing protein, partial [Sphingobacteriales bacterium]
MKNVLIILYLLLFINTVHAANTLSVASPDKSIRVSITTKNTLTYSVFIDDKLILLPSAIDLALENGKKLSGILTIKSIATTTVNQVILSPVPDKRKNIPDNYNELTIHFKQPFSVIFRVYNDGIAYRIATRFKNSIIIKTETALFQFTNGSSIIAPIIQQRDDEDKYHTSFEELYQTKLLDSLNKKDLLFSPALVDEGSIKIAITESDLEDYPGMFLTGAGNNSLKAEFANYPLEEKITNAAYAESIVTNRANYIARTPGTRNLPWRVLMIAREDKQLPANDLVYRLASPSRIKDVSWVHPGKCTDEWIIDINLFNVPFKTGINTATYKFYIDFAKR